MKLTIMLVLLTSLISACGKVKSTTTTTTTSLKSLNTSSLKENGIKIISIPASNSNKAMAAVMCEGTTSTNQKRQNQLIDFKNSIGIGNSETLYFMLGNEKVPTYKMEQILDEAINYLNSSSLIGADCPNSILSFTYL